MFGRVLPRGRTYPLTPFLKEGGTVIGQCLGQATLGFPPLFLGRGGRGERSPHPPVGADISNRHRQAVWQSAFCFWLTADHCLLMTVVPFVSLCLCVSRCSPYSVVALFDHFRRLRLTKPAVSIYCFLLLGPGQHGAIFVRDPGVSHPHNREEV